MIDLKTLDETDKTTATTTTTTSTSTVTTASLTATTETTAASSASTAESTDEMAPPVNVPAVVSRYNGENYGSWRLEVNLTLQELGFKKAGDEFTALELSETNAEIHRAKGVVLRSLVDEKRHLAQEGETLFQWLSKIKDDFAKDSRMIRQRMKQSIMDLKFEGPGQMKPYFEKLEYLVAKLRCAGTTYSEQDMADQVGMALSLVTSQYDHITENSKATYAEIKSTLISKDQAKGQLIGVSANNVLTLENENRKKYM